MTAPLDLAPIEDRDAHAECVDLCHQPQADRRALLAEVKRLRAVVGHIERLRDLAYARGFRGPVGMWLDEALAGPTEPPPEAEPVQWARVSGEATRERRKAEAGGP